MLVELENIAMQLISVKAEIKAMQEKEKALQAELENLLIECPEMKYSGISVNASITETTTNRFDSKAFKASDPETYARFTVVSYGKRLNIKKVS